MEAPVKPLPDAETLARLVSSVTNTMLGISFRPAQKPPSPVPGEWRTALLPINGSRPVTVGLASEKESCSSLSAAMFSCKREDVDLAMMDDSLRELANMTAGMVKNSLGLDALLGLPRIAAGADLPKCETNSLQAVLLEADQLGLLLWVTEGHV
jgi:Chemotaxis phosphatase CheX